MAAQEVLIMALPRMGSGIITAASLLASLSTATPAAIEIWEDEGETQ